MDEYIAKMSSSTLGVKQHVEDMAKKHGTAVAFEIMDPATQNKRGDSGFDSEKGVYSIRVKVKNEDGYPLQLQDVEKTFVHELLHIRQQLIAPLEVFTVTAVNEKYRSIGNPLVGINNIGSLIGHLELYPLMECMGYSVDEMNKRDYDYIISRKSAIAQIVGLKDSVLIADIVIQILEVYLFARPDKKHELEAIHPTISKHLSTCKKLLKTGSLQDDITKAHPSLKIVPQSAVFFNLTKLCEILELTGKQVVAATFACEL